MKGKKKEKRYFCDLCKEVIDRPILLVSIAIVLGISACGISGIATSNYIDKQEEYIDLCGRYSDDAYKEFKKDIRNQLEKGGRIEEVVDSYEGSYDGEKTILNCSKINGNNFVVKITVTTSKNGKILSMDNQFKTKEEYVEQTKSEFCDGKYGPIGVILMVVIYLGIFVLLYKLSKISQKRKAREEVQKVKNKTGFEQ